MKERTNLYLNTFDAKAVLLAWQSTRLILSYPFSN